MANSNILEKLRQDFKNTKNYDPNRLMTLINQSIKEDVADTVDAVLENPHSPVGRMQTRTMLEIARVHKKVRSIKDDTFHIRKKIDSIDKNYKKLAGGGGQGFFRGILGGLAGLVGITGGGAGLISLLKHAKNQKKLLEKTKMKTAYSQYAKSRMANEFPKPARVSKGGPARHQPIGQSLGGPSRHQPIGQYTGGRSRHQAIGQSRGGPARHQPIGQSKGGPTRHQPIGKSQGGPTRHRSIRQSIGNTVRNKSIMSDSEVRIRYQKILSSRDNATRRRSIRQSRGGPARHKPIGQSRGGPARYKSIMYSLGGRIRYKNILSSQGGPARYTGTNRHVTKLLSNLKLLKRFGRPGMLLLAGITSYLDTIISVSTNASYDEVKKQFVGDTAGLFTGLTGAQLGAMFGAPGGPFGIFLGGIAGFGAGFIVGEFAAENLFDFIMDLDQISPGEVKKIGEQLPSPDDMMLAPPKQKNTPGIWKRLKNWWSSENEMESATSTYGGPITDKPNRFNDLNKFSQRKRKMLPAQMKSLGLKPGSPTFAGTPKNRIWTGGIHSAMGSYLYDQSKNQKSSGRSVPSSISGSKNLAGWMAGGNRESRNKQERVELSSELNNVMNQIQAGKSAKSNTLDNMSVTDLKEVGLKRVGHIASGFSYKMASMNISQQDISERMSKESGQFRPKYNLSSADLSDNVINVIAGEARLSDEQGTKAVIHNMLNRVGVQKNWNNLREVATAKGQYEGRRTASKKESEYIKKLIRQAASGTEPDPTGGATEFRASSYVFGAGKGKTFYRQAEKQGFNNIGGNVFARTFEPGDYAPFDEPKTANAKRPQDMQAARNLARRSIINERITASRNLLAKRTNVPASLNTADIRISRLKGNIGGVDPKLVRVMKEASKDLPDGYEAKFISGKDARSTGTKNHPSGLAVDLQIFDDKGKLLPHNKNSPGWKVYEGMARSMHIRGNELYPKEDWIWGGAWISKAAGPGDPMHFQLKDPSVKGSSQSSGRWSFERGLDPKHPFYGSNNMSPEEMKSYDDMVRAKIAGEKVTQFAKKSNDKMPVAAFMGGLGSDSFNTMSTYATKAEKLGIPVISATTTGGYTSKEYETIADKLYQQYKDTGSKEIVISGHSFGGIGAMRVAEILKKKHGVQKGVTLNLVDPVAYNDFGATIPDNVDTANIIKPSASWNPLSIQADSDKTNVNRIRTTGDHVGAAWTSETEQSLKSTLFDKAQGRTPASKIESKGRNNLDVPKRSEPEKLERNETIPEKTKTIEQEDVNKSETTMKTKTPDDGLRLTNKQGAKDSTFKKLKQITANKGKDSIYNELGDIDITGGDYNYI